jgi:RNA polymerase-binding transcription factor DksA
MTERKGAAEMAEQEAQEWRKWFDPEVGLFDIIAVIGKSERTIANNLFESDADRILADHKAQQEVRELQAELARKDQAIKDMLATHVSFAEGARLRAENAQLREDLAVARSAAESWAATAIAGEARERTAKEELARVKAVAESYERQEQERDYYGRSGVISDRRRSLLEENADLRAQLQAAEAERQRQQRVNMQMADAYSATKMAMLHDLTTTTTLLQQAREALEKIEWTYNYGQYCLACGMDGPQHADDCTTALVLAAIDAHEKAGRE